MSVLLGRRLARSGLVLGIHPIVRNRQSVRHSSTILDGLGSCVALTAESLSSLHSAGLPWYMVLPLVATALNFTVRLPAQWLGRYYRLKRNETRPLKLAWAVRDLRKNMRLDQGALSAARDLLKPRAHSKRINKDFGAPMWKSLTTFLGPVIPFVLVSESVRRLAGSPMTWLGTKLGLDRFLDILEPGASTLTDSTLAGGGILWFTDLMAADPYGGLPLICAFTLGWGSWSQIGAERLKQLLSVDERGMPAMQRLQMAFGRVILVVPLFPLLFWNLPSAVFLYWAPTFLFNRVNDVLLKKWLPEPEPRYSMRVIKSQPPRFVGIEGYDIPQKTTSPSPPRRATAPK